VLEILPIAEVKSDLMGEQTILCGMLQTGAILCFDKMVEKGIDAGLRLEADPVRLGDDHRGLKHGGITNMMDRLSNPAKLRAFYLAEELKNHHAAAVREAPGRHHERRVLPHHDGGLGQRRREPAHVARRNPGYGLREDTEHGSGHPEQEYFDHGILLVAMVKAGVSNSPSR
jgi:ketol-acid reductoisomerase